MNDKIFDDALIEKDFAELLMEKHELNDEE